MDSIETRLKHFRLRQPPEGLRERVRRAACPAPPAWRRLIHTVEGCAATVLLVYGSCAWYEQGTVALQKECRIVPPDVQEERCAEQVAVLTEGLDLAELQPYLAAHLLDTYYRPYVVRPSS